MIYIKSFKNYEEFQTIFGMVKHGNGTTSRKNKILLACLKDRKLFHWWKNFRESMWSDASRINADKHDYLKATSMNDLKDFARFLLNEGVYYSYLTDRIKEYGYEINFGDEFPYMMYHPTLRLDALKGLCADGDTKSIRYVNSERDDKVFKMKAGKFISRCIEDNIIGNVMPEQLKRWIGEEFARDWQSYAEQNNQGGRFTLHVDDNFSDIYDSERCKGDFGSCMTNRDYWKFYENAICAKAAYLTDVDGYIVARCIVYQDVEDRDGNHYRLAERQYSTDQNDVLKQILVDMLIKEGEIDGYKRVGAGCHDNSNFVKNDGTSMRNKCLSIECCLDFEEDLSYQDSFVFYNKDKNIAYNDDCMDYQFRLDSTEGQLEGYCYSEYNGEYISEEDSVYDEYYEDYIYIHQSCDAIYNGQCIKINEDRADDDDYWKWSNHENCYIYYDECEYVEVEDDYYLYEDCVKDVDGEWQFKESCEWSTYYGEYILDDKSVWSSIVGSYIHEDKATQCPICKKWYPDDYDEEVYSEITKEYYCSDECLREAEEAFKDEHAKILA